jgi:hypothetical protein
MAAGLTDHVWTLREVLLVRVPPWHSPRRGKRRGSMRIVRVKGKVCLRAWEVA